ncbi:unnamed protein product [Commensalibacter communis]|uniref:Uncharacterized protein n=2 Tax=Commensalibacter communis TaxID=2972786 RepID=A0A9W4TPN7_9PROT|nr:unnamed protein product [Commensalibacter communis]CAI3956596.1 unnamed protein product [Commensalibacter communis]CAI3956672.1 unnamed protein product [Commensalibacter communis]CAI3956979.1 unnamed protein product [Commensalibacter communis]
MSRFAHLMGLRARAEEPDQDPDNQTTDQNDPDNNAGDSDPDPEDPKDQNGRAKGKRAKKAEDDPNDPDAQGDDPSNNAEDEGDDETDAEDEKYDTTAQARARERGRCAAIFGCKAAANNLALAAELAFGTNISRSQAIRLLKAGGIAKPSSSNKPSRTALYDRQMALNRQSVSVGAPQRNQNLSQSAMLSNKILQSAQGTGVVKKEPQ